MEKNQPNKTKLTFFQEKYGGFDVSVGYYPECLF